MSNTFVESQFPPNISYGSTGGSGFNTTIFETASGYEQRNVNWSRSRGKWDVSHAIKSQSDMQELLSFFMAMNGRAYAFRFKDWADYQATNLNLGVGDGVTTNFQMAKTYTDPLVLKAFQRPIQKPVQGTLQMLTVGGVAASGYFVDYTTGIVSFTVAPGSGQQVMIQYVEFDVPARFDTDELKVKQEFWTYQSWEGISVVEVRV